MSLYRIFCYKRKYDKEGKLVKKTEVGTFVISERDIHRDPIQMASRKGIWRNYKDAGNSFSVRIYEYNLRNNRLQLELIGMQAD